MSRTLLVLAASLGMALAIALSGTVSASSRPESRGLSHDQRQQLEAIARDTWRFFDADTDPSTHLPLDNIGFNGAPARGTYTSPTNIGVYFWSVVAAHDMGLIDRRAELERVSATLGEVERLSKWKGFCSAGTTRPRAPHRYTRGPQHRGQAGQRPAHLDRRQRLVRQWPDPGAPGVSRAGASGDRAAQRRWTSTSSMTRASQSPQHHRRPDVRRLYRGHRPANFHYGLLNTETRIAAYIGIGTHRMPGDVWWRTWRTLPADFTWQGQVPQGATVTYRDPQSGKSFDVFEGHYSYGGQSFVPSWGGSMFEALMRRWWCPRTTGVHAPLGSTTRSTPARRLLTLSRR